jgi:hypothetical protein
MEQRINHNPQQAERNRCTTEGFMSKRLISGLSIPVEPRGRIEATLSYGVFDIAEQGRSRPAASACWQRSVVNCP